jgi:predicted acylesterase/phospholipase RssA
MGLSFFKSTTDAANGATGAEKDKSDSGSAVGDDSAIKSALVDAADLVDFPYGWTNLVCEGGGVKCVAMCGSLKVLEVARILPLFQQYAGSSAGAIISSLLSIGYDVDTMIRILMSTSFDQLLFKDISMVNRVYSLVESYGCYDGLAYMEWIGKLLRDKGFDPDISFGTLHSMTGKTLVITGCNVNSGRTEYFSWQQTPDMSVRLAVRISISIPFLLRPVEWNNALYIDGGVFNNYPIDCFDSVVPGDRDHKTEANPRTLGLKFIGFDDKADKTLYYHHNSNMTNVVQYGVAIFSRALDEIERLHIDNEYWTRTIAIPTGQCTTMDFALTKHQKVDLLKNGSQAAAAFLKKWVREHQRRPSFLKWLRRASTTKLAGSSEVSGDTLAMCQLISNRTSLFFPLSPDHAKNNSEAHQERHASCSISMNSSSLTTQQLQELREEVKKATTTPTTSHYHHPTIDE